MKTPKHQKFNNNNQNPIGLAIAFLGEKKT